MMYVVSFAISFLALFGSTVAFLAYSHAKKLKKWKRREILYKGACIGFILSFVLLTLVIILARILPTVSGILSLAFWVICINATLWDKISEKIRDNTSMMDLLEELSEKVALDMEACEGDCFYEIRDASGGPVIIPTLPEKR